MDNTQYVPMKGDIICRLRSKGLSFWDDPLGWGILFFTTSWWDNEPGSRSGHSEMVYDKTRSISMQPPKVKLRNVPIGHRCVIFRLRNKPDDFEDRFDQYVKYTWDHRYDFVKFAMFLMDWIFHTHWFTRKFVSNSRDVCSEFVAWFYQWIGRRCSRLPANSTTPDDIMDYCIAHDEQFEMVYALDDRVLMELMDDIRSKILANTELVRNSKWMGGGQ